jgi:hypothetical protein
MGNSTNSIKTGGNKMKRTMNLLGIIVLLFFCSTPLFGQEGKKYSQNVTFPEPSKPGIVRITGGEGDITITGYKGKVVLIETELDIYKSADEDAQVEDEKAKGLKRISGSSFNVATNDEENAIIINRGMNDENDLIIQVPVSTSLKIGSGNYRGGSLSNIVISSKDHEGKEQVVKLRDMAIEMKEKEKEMEEKEKEMRETVKISTGFPITIPRIPFIGGVFQGDVTITNVSGTIEINAVESDITLKDISGKTTVSTVDGDLVATFKDIDKDKPLYLSSVDGDLDVTLPSNIQADLSLQTLDGEMFTDFDIDITLEPEQTTKGDRRSTDMVRFFRAGNAVYGKINGGGSNIQIKTVDGNIYLRKGE